VDETCHQPNKTDTKTVVFRHTYPLPICNYHQSNVTVRIISMQKGAAVMYIIKHHVMSMLQGPESTAPNILDLCTKQR